VNSDTDEMLNRRVIIQVLFAYFERDQNDDVFALLCRLLGLSPEEKRRLMDARSKQSIGGQVKRIASYFSPFDSESNASTDLAPLLKNPDANTSLADMWANFLLQETMKSGNQQLKSPSAPSSAPSTPQGGHHHLVNESLSRSQMLTPQPHSATSNMQQHSIRPPAYIPSVQPPHPTASSFTPSNHDRTVGLNEPVASTAFLHNALSQSSQTSFPPPHTNGRTVSFSNHRNFPLPSFPIRNPPPTR
jgi:hypothetical protein